MNDDTQALPAQAVTAAIERIAAQWDGCMYAGPGGCIDIGRDIRAAAQAAPAEAQQATAPPTLASLRGIASMPAGQTAEGIVAASRGEWADAPAQAPTDADIVKLLHALGVTEFDDLCAGETRSAVVRRWLAGFGVPGDAALPDAPEAAK